MIANIIDPAPPVFNLRLVRMEPPETAKANNRKQKNEEARQQKMVQAMARLGVTNLPGHYTDYLPVAQLAVEGEITREEERSARHLADNLKALGTLLHPPTVEADSSSYRVLAGRRRVLAARLAGLEQIECSIYPTLTPAQRRAVALSENFTRSPNRKVELEGVCRLVRANAFVTEKELCAIFGLSPGTARKYLKVAQLPAPLVEEAVSGNLSLSMAGQIVRLSGEQQEKLAELVEEGENISEEQVHSLRYARTSRNLAQLASSFEEVDELAERMMVGKEVISTGEALTPVNRSLTPENGPTYYAEVLVQLKQFATEKWPGRSARQIGLYIDALLAELGGLQ